VSEALPRCFPAHQRKPNLLTGHSLAIIMVSSTFKRQQAILLTVIWELTFTVTALSKSPLQAVRLCCSIHGATIRRGLGGFGTKTNFPKHLLISACLRILILTTMPFTALFQQWCLTGWLEILNLQTSRSLDLQTNTHVSHLVGTTGLMHWPNLVLMRAHPTT